MSSEIPRCDVIVVGAGVAGLVAAQALSRAGRTVKCFEARPRVGGRALTVERSGLAIDLGATWFWHNEPLVQANLDQRGLEAFPQSTFGDAVFEPAGHSAQRLDGNPIDSPAQRFRSGAQSLPLALAAEVACGVLNLGDPVTAIRWDGRGVVVEAASGLLGAEHVIVALPPSLAVEAIAFAPELPSSVREAAAGTSVWMGDTIKAIAVYAAPFWRHDQLAGAAISYQGPFREFHDHGGPGDAGAGAIFGFAPADAFPGGTDEDVSAAFRAQLGRLFGPEAATPESVVVTNWKRERYTSPAHPSPNASPAGFGHPSLTEPTGEGRIHWASTETDASYGGHVEGAIRAGLRAARRVEESLAR